VGDLGKGSLNLRSGPLLAWRSRERNALLRVFLLLPMRLKQLLTLCRGCCTVGVLHDAGVLLIPESPSHLIPQTPRAGAGLLPGRNVFAWTPELLAQLPASARAHQQPLPSVTPDDDSTDSAESSQLSFSSWHQVPVLSTAVSAAEPSVGDEEVTQIQGPSQSQQQERPTKRSRPAANPSQLPPPSSTYRQLYAPSLVLSNNLDSSDSEMDTEPATAAGASSSFPALSFSPATPKLPRQLAPGAHHYRGRNTAGAQPTAAVSSDFLLGMRPVRTCKRPRSACSQSSS
jgi:hypothetical protein